MVNTADIPTKISFVALRQLHARTVAFFIMDAMNALSLSEEARDATSTADCIQAMRAVLIEHTINYQYAPVRAHRLHASLMTRIHAVLARLRRCQFSYEPYCQTRHEGHERRYNKARGVHC